MKNDVIIIGGGFTGRAVARRLQEEGLIVAMIDDRDKRAWSRVYGGLWGDSWLQSDFWEAIRPEWWRQEHYIRARSNVLAENTVASPFLVAPSLSWADGVVQIAGGASLDAIDGEVSGGSYDDKTGLWTIIYDGRSIQGRKIVIAAGYQTPEVLRRLSLRTVDIKSVRGRYFLFDSAVAPHEPVFRMSPSGPLWMLRTGPFTIRIGDTYEDEKSNPVAQVEEIVEFGRMIDPDLPAPYKNVEGFRSVGPEGKPFVSSVGPDAWAVGGGGRIGLGIAGGLAHHLTEVIV